MKTIYLIHGWGVTPEEEPWFSWFKEIGEEKGWKVVMPEMPDTDNPTIDAWVEKLAHTIIESENVYLVGHSIGAQTIMRYIEKYPNKKVAGIVFVAGWFNILETGYEDPEEEKPIAKPWLETPINTDVVKNAAQKITAIFSKDDVVVPVSDADIFKEKLGAHIIIKENEGHFDETTNIPEVVEAIEQ